MINNTKFISEIIMGFAQEVISEISYNDESRTKRYEQGGIVEDDTYYSVDKTEDLGYAVVVDDDGNDI